MENSKSKIKFFVAYNKPSAIFQSEIFQPIFNGKVDFELPAGMLRDNSGEQISEKNPNFGELTGHYWLWKNYLPQLDVEYVGFCQYRRFLDFNLTNIGPRTFQPLFAGEFPQMFQRYTQENILKFVENYDVVLSNKVGFNISIYEQYLKYHPKKDMDIALGIIDEIYPEYSECAKEFMASNTMHVFGCFVMKKELFSEYMTWMFNILSELEKRCDWSEYNEYFTVRTPAFIAERFLNIWLLHNVKARGLKVTGTTSVLLHSDVKAYQEQLQAKQEAKMQVIQKSKLARGVFIEISGGCNAKCLYCCRGSGNHKTTDKYMGAEKFEKIVKHLIDIEVVPKEKSLINLYNWSEPFLNPEMDGILEALERQNKLAGISSNFIKDVDIKPENYKNIHSVVFSICSLKTDDYKRVYGADLEKVLRNFDRFLANKNKYNPNLKVSVNWLKYKFNEDETQMAQDYFGARGVGFNVGNYYAYINDGNALINYCNGMPLEGYDIEQAKKDIDFDRFENLMKNHAREDFNCPQLSYITINEAGQLDLCCVVTSKNEEYNLGDILTLDYNDILKLKENTKMCQKCQKAKLPWFYHYGFGQTVEELEAKSKSETKV